MSKFKIEAKPQLKEPEHRKRVTMTLTEPDGLYEFLIGNAAQNNVNISDLCKQMILHCAKDLGFDGK